MRINYGAADRKKMVKAIGEALEEKPIYQGVPSCAYQIAEFTVTRDGNLEFPDDTDPEIVNGLLDALEEAGFQFPENEEHAVSVDTEVCTDEDGSVTTEKTAVKVDQLETPTELTISLPTMESVALERLLIRRLPLMKLPSNEQLAQIRADFPPRTRVVLEYMDDPYAPPVGTHGTVITVDSLGDLIMRWDNGSGLNVCLEVDRVRKEDNSVG